MKIRFKYEQILTLHDLDADGFEILSSYWEKWNERGFRPPLCTHRLNSARTTRCSRMVRWHVLPSRHKIWNSSPSSLRPNTLPLGHGAWAGKRHFVSLKLEGQSRVRTRELRLSFNHCTRAPATFYCCFKFFSNCSSSLTFPWWSL